MNIAHTKKMLVTLNTYKLVSLSYEYLNNSEENKLIMQRANELCEHIFVFDKTWDMERCLIPYQLVNIDWNTQRNDDEEWCFMLNRMDYLVYLAHAYTLSNDTLYLTTCKDFILSWINQHPTILKEPSTRTLDTGIRILNMLQATSTLFAYDIISNDELVTIMTSLHLQIQYLKKQYINKYRLSNWGSIQVAAILCVLPFIEENYQVDTTFIWAKEEYKEQMQIQVYRDGTYWEQSVMYHVDVLNYGMSALFYQNLFHYELDPSIYENLKRLCTSLFHQMTPKYESETFGDSDRCLLCDVFTRATSIFHSSMFKSGGFTSYDYESLYQFGCREADNYLNIKKTTSDVLFFDGIDAGLFTIRSAWQPQANFTMFTNGSLGSGHGHCDNLHLSVYYKGQPFLIDTGRFTYREDEMMRLTLKSMMAHNTVIVDDMPCSVPSTSWDIEKFCTPLKTYVSHVQNTHYLEGSILASNYLHTRKITIIDCGIWLIHEEIHASGKHYMNTLFHCDPSIHVTALTPMTKKLIGLENTLTLYLDTDNLSDKITSCSLRYNEISPHHVIETKHHFVDDRTSTTALCDSSILVEDTPILQDNKEVVQRDLAEAKTFILSEHESYTIGVFHKEVYVGKKIFSCKGVFLHAKAFVIHELHGKKECIRLKC
ncbi:MAG: heparinase II/III family protein [Longicatena sp.]